MVTQLTSTKPSRSDEVLTTEEQINITNQIKAQFEALTPKRPIKPNRSEPDPQQNPIHTTFPLHDMPELQKFQSLKSDSSHTMMFSNGSGNTHDEFVETQYYNQLLLIDKQHHTTGSGFIKVVKEGDESGYEIQLPVGESETRFRSYKSNPATNDWVPNIDQQYLVQEIQRS